MQPEHCRELLARLLDEEAAALTALQPLLAREHELLTANDVEGLERAGTARLECVARLLRIEDERRGLCRMLGLEQQDAVALGQLLTWCDPQGTLRARHADCAARAQSCRDQNDRNGLLVGARLKHVEGMLGMLSTHGRDARTYGPGGRADSRTLAPGHLLAAQA